MRNLLWLVLFLVFILFLLNFNGFYLLSYSLSSDFNGSFFNTLYNNGVVLMSGNSSGVYASPVIDAGSVSSWDSLEWLSDINYNSRLPDNNGIDAGSDMRGNLLLMHFDGNVQDSSGNNNVLLIDNPNFTVGVYGSGFRINSGEFLISNASPASLVSSFNELSVEVFFKNSSVSQNGGIVRKGNYYGLGISTGVITSFVYSGGTIFLLNASPFNDWNHVIMTYDNSLVNNFKLYVNGVLKSQASVPSPLIIESGSFMDGDLRIGSFNGTIDELAIYDRALSSDEVLNHYKRSVLFVNLSVRSCDDSLCNGESWIDAGNTSPAFLSLKGNRFFQYRFGFRTKDLNYYPKVSNVKVNFNPLFTGFANVTYVNETDVISGFFNEQITDSASSISSNLSVVNSDIELLNTVLSFNVSSNVTSLITELSSVLELINDSSKSVDERRVLLIEAESLMNNISVLSPKVSVVSYNSRQVSNTVFNASIINNAINAIGSNLTVSLGLRVNEFKKVLEVNDSGVVSKVTVKTNELINPLNTTFFNVTLINVIPKSYASSVNELSFYYPDNVIVLESDPIIAWFFERLMAGEKVIVGYEVDKDVSDSGDLDSYSILVNALEDSGLLEAPSDEEFIELSMESELQDLPEGEVIESESDSSLIIVYGLIASVVFTSLMIGFIIFKKLRN